MAKSVDLYKDMRSFIVSFKMPHDPKHKARIVVQEYTAKEAIEKARANYPSSRHFRVESGMRQKEVYDPKADAFRYAGERLRRVIGRR